MASETVGIPINSIVARVFFTCFLPNRNSPSGKAYTNAQKSREYGYGSVLPNGAA
jgi:hypothetical protein